MCARYEAVYTDVLERLRGEARVPAVEPASDVRLHDVNDEYVESVTTLEAPPPRAERWTAQWKELYAEVITTGLCTGCAGCVVTCPHDVIGYEHAEKASTCRSISRTSSVWLTASMG